MKRFIAAGLVFSLVLGAPGAGFYAAWAAPVRTDVVTPLLAAPVAASMGTVALSAPAATPASSLLSISVPAPASSALAPVGGEGEGEGGIRRFALTPTLSRVREREFPAKRPAGRLVEAGAFYRGDKLAQAGAVGARSENDAAFERLLGGEVSAPGSLEPAGAVLSARERGGKRREKKEAASTAASRPTIPAVSSAPSASGEAKLDPRTFKVPAALTVRIYSAYAGSALSAAAALAMITVAPVVLFWSHAPWLGGLGSLAAAAGAVDVGSAGSGAARHERGFSAAIKSVVSAPFLWLRGASAPTAVPGEAAAGSAASGANAPPPARGPVQWKNGDGGGRWRITEDGFVVDAFGPPDSPDARRALWPIAEAVKRFGERLGVEPSRLPTLAAVRQYFAPTPEQPIRSDRDNAHSYYEDGTPMLVVGESFMDSDPRERDGILGHELGHLFQNDLIVFKRLIKLRKAAAGAWAVTGMPLLAAAAWLAHAAPFAKGLMFYSAPFWGGGLLLILADFLSLAYRRAQELRADRFSAWLTHPTHIWRYLESQNKAPDPAVTRRFLTSAWSLAGANTRHLSVLRRVPARTRMFLTMVGRQVQPRLDRLAKAHPDYRERFDNLRPLIAPFEPSEALKAAAEALHRRLGPDVEAVEVVHDGRGFAVQATIPDESMRALVPLKLATPDGEIDVRVLIEPKLNRLMDEVEKLLVPSAAADVLALADERGPYILAAAWNRLDDQPSTIPAEYQGLPIVERTVAPPAKVAAIARRLAEALGAAAEKVEPYNFGKGWLLAATMRDESPATDQALKSKLDGSGAFEGLPVHPIRSPEIDANRAALEAALPSGVAEAVEVASEQGGYYLQIILRDESAETYAALRSALDAEGKFRGMAVRPARSRAVDAALDALRSALVPAIAESVEVLPAQGGGNLLQVAVRDESPENVARLEAALTKEESGLRTFQGLPVLAVPAAPPADVEAKRQLLENRLPLNAAAIRARSNGKEYWLQVELLTMDPEATAALAKALKPGEAPGEPSRFQSLPVAYFYSPAPPAVEAKRAELERRLVPETAARVSVWPSAEGHFLEIQVNDERPETLARAREPLAADGTFEGVKAVVARRAEIQRKVLALMARLEGAAVEHVEPIWDGEGYVLAVEVKDGGAENVERVKAAFDTDANTGEFSFEGLPVQLFLPNEPAMESSAAPAEPAKDEPNSETAEIENVRGPPAKRRQPRVTCDEFIAVLLKLGFKEARKMTSSHRVYVDDAGHRVIVQYHRGRILSPKHFQDKMKNTGIPPEEFLKNF